jgi:tyrosine-protein kinase Etk/Wzc
MTENNGARQELRVEQLEQLNSSLRSAEPTIPHEMAHAADVPRSGVFNSVLFLARGRRMILGAAVLGGLISGTIAFLLPPMYTATALIMPPQQQQSSVSAMLGQLGPIAGLAGRDLGIHDPADVYVGILAGRTIADDLIETFALQSLYGAKTFTDTRKILAGRSSFFAGKGSLIKISVEDHDPKRAAALANAYVDELHKQTNRLALTESAQRRIFFEQQLEAENRALANAETALKATQERTGVLQVNSQVEAVIRSLAQLRAEIASREVALSSLKKAATARNPEVVRQETELAAMREQLAGLEMRAGTDGSPDVILPTSEVPKVGLEYVRALRDVKYHETLFELTSKQYEAARMDEAKETPVIQVVDSAVPPERKSAPSRTLLAATGFFGFGFVGWILAAARNHFQTAAGMEKLRLLKVALSERQFVS